MQLQPSTSSERERVDVTIQQRIKSWGRRLLDPSIIVRFQKAHPNANTADDDGDGFPLLSSPWKLDVYNRVTQDGAPAAADILTDDRKYPKASHLEIRQTQNEDFCRDRLHRGIAAAKQGNSNEARACYQEGLDLMPDHADLLVAMGALLANQRNFVQAQELLQRALAVDAQHEDAANYLAQVQAATNRSTKTAKSVAARQDVQMEQSMLGGRTTATTVAHGDGQYELLLDDSEEDRLSDKHRKSKKRKEKKKRKRGRKRDKRDSDSDDDDSTSADSSDYYRRKKKRRRKKKSKKQRKTTSDNDAADLSTSSSDTVDSRKLVPAKIAHKPTK